MHAIDRVTSYLCLQLVSAGYYCMEPGHLPVSVLVAGRDEEGFVLLVEEDAKRAAVARVPAELRFLKLSVHRAFVRENAAPRNGRPKLEVTLDADLLARLPVATPGEFGILLQPSS